MRIAIHQPEHIGYLGYYNKMFNADAWVILDNVQMAKRDFVRRNRIRTANGSMWLSVPVRTKGRYHQRICDVEIESERNWQKSHWKSIEQNYRRAPYFETYAPAIHAMYERPWHKIADLNIAFMQCIMALLGIERPLYTASALGVEGKSSQLLADLTATVGGTEYLSGPMGREYLDESIFAERGLTVSYNDFCHPVYSQHHGEFIPYMAVIDLLFNHGPDSLDIIRAGTADITLPTNQ